MPEDGSGYTNRCRESVPPCRRAFERNQAMQKRKSGEPDATSGSPRSPRLRGFDRIDGCHLKSSSEGHNRRRQKRGWRRTKKKGPPVMLVRTFTALLRLRFWLEAQPMSVLSESEKRDHIRYWQCVTGHQIFIETGTYLGETTL